MPKRFCAPPPHDPGSSSAGDVHVNVLDAADAARPSGAGRAASATVGANGVTCIASDDRRAALVPGIHGPIFVTSRRARWRSWTGDHNAWGGQSIRPMRSRRRGPGRVGALLGLRAFRPGIVMEGGSLDVNGRGALLATSRVFSIPTTTPTLESGRDRAPPRGASSASATSIWLGDGIAGDDTGRPRRRHHALRRARYDRDRDRDDPADGIIGLAGEPRRACAPRAIQDGEPFTILELPMPRPVEREGQRLAGELCQLLYWRTPSCWCRLRRSERRARPRGAARAASRRGGSSGSTAATVVGPRRLPLRDPAAAVTPREIDLTHRSDTPLRVGANTRNLSRPPVRTPASDSQCVARHLAPWDRRARARCAFAQLVDPDQAKAVVNCTRRTSAAAAPTDFINNSYKALKKCVDAIFACVQLKPDDPAAACRRAQATLRQAVLRSLDAQALKLELAIDKRCAEEVISFATPARRSLPTSTRSRPIAGRTASSCSGRSTTTSDRLRASYAVSGRRPAALAAPRRARCSASVGRGSRRARPRRPARTSRDPDAHARRRSNQDADADADAHQHAVGSDCGRATITVSPTLTPTATARRRRLRPCSADADVTTGHAGAAIAFVTSTTAER